MVVDVSQLTWQGHTLMRCHDGEDFVALSCASEKVGGLDGHCSPPHRGGHGKVRRSVTSPCYCRGGRERIVEVLTGLLIRCYKFPGNPA
jgi:hypothetical protein